MGGRSSIQLAKIFGIRIGVTSSWFVVLFVFIFLLSGNFRDVLNSSDTVAYATAVASALLFFLSILLHEFGHALMARRLGIEVQGIDLWFFGGIAKISRDPDSPGEEFKVAIAGPIVTLAIVGLCTGIGVLADGWDGFWNAVVLRTGRQVSPGLLLLGWLGTINAALFVFNLVPAFPLDGGRLARAAIWKWKGDRLVATRGAATLGQGFAYILIGLGIAETLVVQTLSGLYLVLLGWFLLQAARGAVVQTAFAERLGGVTVADLMDEDPLAIPASYSVTRAQEEYFLRYRWPWFPVVDAEGRPLGVVQAERVDGAERAGDGELTVGELLDVEAAPPQVRADATLDTLLGSEPLRRLGTLLAVDEHGVLRGLVTIDQVRKALANAATGPQAPPVPPAI
jgi:Zn-dependent protease